MGLVQDNLLTKGFSGRIGDEIVFRQVGNRTLFAKRPRKRTTFTPEQAAQQVLFQDAVYYAKAALLDPAILADYQQLAKEFGLRSAYNAAITDFLKAPEIARVYTGSYKGEVGNVIFIAPADSFKVKELTVTIQLADGTVVETGAGIPEQGEWKYIATQPNAAVAGSKLVIKAKDRPGKEITFEQQL